MLQVAINNSRPQCNPKTNRSSTKPGPPKPHLRIFAARAALCFGVQLLLLARSPPLIGGYDHLFIGSPIHALFWLLQLSKVSEYLRISQKISEYLRISQNISEYLRISQNISEDLRISQNISEYLRRSQNWFLAKNGGN